MARSFPLDKIVPAGTTFQTDKREAFIISWIGTNSATDGTLKVEDKRVITIKELVAPLRTKGTNLLGPLDLGDFYIVIPPETKYVWDAPSGTALRIIGTKVQLDPLEQLGEPYTTRYKRQFNEGIVYLEGTYSHGTDTAWIAGLEREVLSIRPSTIEKYVFNSVVMAAFENVSGGVNEGDWGITFYLDGQPLEYIHHDGEKRGIAFNSLSRDHLPFATSSSGSRGLSTPSLGIISRCPVCNNRLRYRPTTFQLPLSGSLDPASEM